MRSAVLLALGVGCGFSVHGDRGVDSGVPDARDAPMPTDAPASDTPLAADASQPDAFVPPPPATCGAPQAMPDDFSTTADWVATTGVTAAGDQITLDATDGNAAIYALPAVGLVDAAATVQVVQAAGSAGATAFYAIWQGSGGDEVVGLSAVGSDLEEGFWSADGSSSVHSVAFDGSAMVFWQISESAGSVSFATSRDGSAWSAPIYSVPTPAWAPYAHLFLDTGGSGTAIGVYTELDGSDAGSAMPWCAADTFHGTPGSDSLTTWWTSSTRSNAECTFGGSGALALSSGQNCWYATSSRYDLVDSSFVVHWGSDTQAAAQPIIALLGTASTGEYFYAYNGYVYDYPGDHYVAHAFSAAGADAYWRVTEYSALQELELSISSDGSAWVPVLLVPEPFAPSGIFIGAGINAAGSGRVLGVN